ncbi:DUF202 domain-containing protein [Mycobacterium sp.]|uniref:DUF202 domain-containing protein n=1 Tax=Mycobacterium sp. TaxID=1785 RepID=UPI002CDF0DA9|nr:DUF202 domain-containing protein [Mycobacterium sp.]HME46771.1 DUF202 domain-containing protein [Mycobacterium sp.]
MTGRDVRAGGLQAERTALAWTRTSFAVLGNGVLLVLKQLPHYRGSAPLSLAGIAAVVALCVYVIGLQRQRTLARRPLPDEITPRREVQLVGGLLIALTLVVAVWLFV